MRKLPGKPKKMLRLLDPIPAADETDRGTRCLFDLAGDGHGRGQKRRGPGQAKMACGLVDHAVGSRVAKGRTPDRPAHEGVVDLQVVHEMAP